MPTSILPEGHYAFFDVVQRYLQQAADIVVVARSCSNDFGSAQERTHREFSRPHGRRPHENVSKATGFNTTICWVRTRVGCVFMRQ